MTDEPYYCSQQITIPPDFPDILKEFTKAAIVTQPKDLLRWSAAYFKAISCGKVPPVKDHIESFVATQKTDTGLTLGLIKVLHKELSDQKYLQLDDVLEKWLDLAIPRQQFDDIVRIGNFVENAEWLHFVALCTSAVSYDLRATLKHVCQILTKAEDGSGEFIPFDTWIYLYKYLATTDTSINHDSIDKVVEFMSYYAGKQGGYVQPSNFYRKDCPSLI